jgi:hypothetical protein
MADYCLVCQLVVAPKAPDRIQVGANVLHKPCLLRHQVNRHQPSRFAPPVRKTRFPFFQRR